MEIENVINAVIKLAKKKSYYKEENKMTIVAECPETLVESDIKTQTFMDPLI